MNTPTTTTSPLTNRRCTALSLLLVMAVAGFAATDAHAQQTTVVKPMSLSGPRAGLLMFTADEAKAIKEMGLDPYTMLLGWQFEISWLSTKSGTAGLFEIVPMISGFDQGQFWPTVNALIGLRSAGGIEGGMGIQAGLTGVAAAFAVGATIDGCSLKFPIHLAIVRAKDGIRAGVLFGFSTANEAQ